jgi:hypothetical protein
MPDPGSRAALVQELRDALQEVARLSEMMSVLLATHHIDESKAQELRKELATAKLRADQLRQTIETSDGLS